MGVRPLLDPSELTVVRKGPAATPEFAREWMRILEGDPAAVGASYMADDDPAPDRIFPNESCNFRMSAWLWVVERAAAFSFVQCDAPSVSMWTGGTAAPHQPGKAEADIRWHMGVHPQQFAQAAIPLTAITLSMKHISIEAPQAEATGRVPLVEVTWPA